MADTLSVNGRFNPELITDLFSKVRGKSSIAALSAQTPIAFNGNEIMTFSMDDEIALVGENEKKEAGHMDLGSVKIIPVKVEYGHRVSDEFIYASEEKQIDTLRAFNDGFAVKVARGLDIMAFHKMNPRTKTVSSLINSSFADVTNTATYNADTPDDSLNDAINLLGDYDCTGIALSKTMATALGNMKASTDSNQRMYPEFAFGAQATSFYGTPCSVNSTVSFDDATMAIVGDFAGAFRWGYAKQIPLEVIQYGDPDNTGCDLKGYNQVYLRAEVYLGWAILDPAAFAKIAGTSPDSVVKTASAKASK